MKAHVKHAHRTHKSSSLCTSTQKSRCAWRVIFLTWLFFRPGSFHIEQCGVGGCVHLSSTPNISLGMTKSPVSYTVYKSAPCVARRCSEEASGSHTRSWCQTHSSRWWFEPHLAQRCCLCRRNQRCWSECQFCRTPCTETPPDAHSRPGKWCPTCGEAPCGLNAPNVYTGSIRLNTRPK